MMIYVNPFLVINLILAVVQLAGFQNINQLKPYKVVKKST